jgi:lipid-A-disaccharide synthase
MTRPKLSLMIVAGEPSGDAHGASLVQELRASAPDTDFEFFGSTGELLRNAGVESVVRADDLAIMGIVEVARVLPRFLRAFRQLKAAALARRPDAVILVDWPEFNLRLARALHRSGLRIIYYISPQVWAWRSYRVRQLRRDVDLLLSILPFEKEWFAERGMKEVEFVGHPLAGEVHARFDRAEFCRRNKLDLKLPIVSLLPGSRRKEIERILPPMLEAAALISVRHPQIQFVVVVAPSRSSDEIRKIVRAQRSLPQPLPSCLHIITDQSREALAASDAAAVASGTATLEAALLETPMVVVYKESAINWHVLGSLINVDHYGLVNLVAGERVVTELMQNELTGDRLAMELMSLLEEDRNIAMQERLNEVAEALGEGGASRRAAERVVERVRAWATEMSNNRKDKSEYEETITEEP